VDASAERGERESLAVLKGEKKKEKGRKKKRRQGRFVADLSPVESKIRSIAPEKEGQIREELRAMKKMEGEFQKSTPKSRNASIRAKKTCQFIPRRRNDKGLRESKGQWGAE